MAKVSWERAWTSPVIRTTPISTSRGNICGRPRTHGAEQNLGAIGAAYNLTMDPFEKYDMTFNGAVASRQPNPSPGNYAGQDNGWALALIYSALIDFDKSIIEYPSIKRYAGGASNDLRPNLQHPENPVPLLDLKNPPRVQAGGG
jgi:hypothetical protein